MLFIIWRRRDIVVRYMLGFGGSDVGRRDKRSGANAREQHVLFVLDRYEPREYVKEIDEIGRVLRQPLVGLDVAER